MRPSGCSALGRRMKSAASCTETTRGSGSVCSVQNQQRGFDGPTPKQLLCRSMGEHSMASRLQDFRFWLAGEQIHLTRAGTDLSAAFASTQWQSGCSTYRNSESPCNSRPAAACTTKGQPKVHTANCLTTGGIDPPHKWHGRGIGALLARLS